MKLGDIINSADVISANVPLSAAVGGICADSRQIRGGELFICIPGVREDGHAYAAAAVAAGAAAVLTERPMPPLPYIEVADTRAAWAYAEDAAAGFPSRRLRFIAVTGTNGKTTVSYLLRSIIEAAGERCGLCGTVGEGMTTPDPPLLYPLLADYAAASCRWVVMEASSHSLSQRRLAPLHFDCAVFTNLSEEHLDYHGNMEDYFAAKASLFRHADVAAVNTADRYGARLYDELGEMSGIRRVSFSATDRAGADYLAERVVRGADPSPARPFGGLRYELVGRGENISIESPMPWRHNLPNTMTAASAALSLGIDSEAVRRGIAALSCVPGRLEPLSLSRGGSFARGRAEPPPLLFIDYAHTPDALASTLLSLRDGMRLTCEGDAATDRRHLMLLFGCGGDRDPGKRPAMGRIASRLADYTVITSDNSRSERAQDIIRQIMRGFDRERAHAVVTDRREAIFHILRAAQPGDVILLAGKGHEDYEIDRRGKHPFSEKRVVAEYLRGTEEDGEE